MIHIRLLLLIMILFLLPTLLYAQDEYYDDEDSITFLEAGRMILIGGGIALVGFIVSQVKLAEGVGKIILGIGGIFAVMGVIGIAISIFETLWRTTINLGFKLAVVIGIGYILYLIGRGIYSWFTKSTPPK